MPKTKRKVQSPVRVVLVTAPEKEAEPIARKLLEEKLIACANLLPGVTSLYRWDGKINRDAEVLIVMKSTGKLMPKLLKRLKQLHSYQVPEFLALPVLEANPAYEKWVVDSTSGKPV